VAWENYAFQLHQHHHNEEQIFWPMARELGAQPSLMDDLDGEHAQMIAVLATADAAMNAFVAEPNAHNTAAVSSAVDQLERAIETHLAHEERDLESFVAAQTSTPQFSVAQRAVRKAHRGKMGTFCAWLLDGADPDVRNALRHEIPRPVIFAVTHTRGRAYTRRVASVWVQTISGSQSHQEQAETAGPLGTSRVP
jgi:hypothetical protein